jgi:NAD(P)H-hydrate epimerase
VKTVVEDVNASGKPVVSIDLPSGLSADRPEPIGPAIKASLTVTLGAAKLPLVLSPGDGFAGRLAIADIGIPREVIDRIDGPAIRLLTPEVLRGRVPPRAVDSHKGDYGRVLVVAGSRGKTGAAHLAAMGALRSGAGLVTVATPAGCVAVVAAMGAEYMTEPLAEDAAGTIGAGAGDRVLGLHADVIAIGPGLGQSPGVTAAVRAVVEQARVPVVLDADGLNAFAGRAGDLADRRSDLVLTPHAGEFARLANVGAREVAADRVAHVRKLAAETQAVVLLKGSRTLVGTPDGAVRVNPTGGPFLATGGTGDVLTGMIAAWLAQLLDAEAACRVAVYLHGAAGELADADSGEVSMIAGDLVDHIGDAILELTARRRVVQQPAQE